MAYTILIAEDDSDIIKLLKLYLIAEGYQVRTADNGKTAFEIIQQEEIGLAILDIMMPQMDGYELTQKIRKIKSLPILILSAKSEDTDKILGLNLGADDYLTKPFNPLEVVARVGAGLRRFYHLNTNTEAIQSASAVFRLGDLELDTERLTLQKNGQEIILTPNEYKLLAFLMKSPGRVYTKSQLCEAINGEYYENYENAIMVHISHLRDKLEDDPKAPRYIKNVRGVGYKIEGA